MSGSTLSVLSIELEASQARLDRDLDRAEQKAKTTGEKMEGSLSLSRAADGMVKIFAALGTVEAGFKALSGVTQLFKGDIAGALDSFEQMPFGIGPAVGAARDFFEVVSGSREEAERLAAEWGKIASKINTAKSEADKLFEQQRASDAGPADSINERSARFNEALAEQTAFINKLIRMQNRSGGDFELSDELQQQLKDIGIEATKAAEAVDMLRESNKKLYQTGVRAGARDVEAVRNSADAINEQAIRESRAALGTENDADLELKRYEAFIAMKESLDKATTDQQRAAIENLHRLRIELIEDEARRRRELEQAQAKETLRQQEEFLKRRKKQEQAEAERMQMMQQREAEQAERDSFIRAKGIEADEFLRATFQGGQIGKPQEVKDPEALGELKAANASLETIARNIGRQAAVMT